MQGGGKRWVGGLGQRPGHGGGGHIKEPGLHSVCAGEPCRALGRAAAAFAFSLHHWLFVARDLRE